MTAREAAYARVLPFVALYNDYRQKARFGASESRAFYRRQAARMEAMVGALVAIARVTPDMVQA